MLVKPLVLLLSIHGVVGNIIFPFYLVNSLCYCSAIKIEPTSNYYFTNFTRTLTRVARRDLRIQSHFNFAAKSKANPTAAGGGFYRYGSEAGLGETSKPMHWRYVFSRLY